MSSPLQPRHSPKEKARLRECEVVSVSVRGTPLRQYARLSFREIGEPMDRSEDAASILSERAKAQLAKALSQLRLAREGWE